MTTPADPISDPDSTDDGNVRSVKGNRTLWAIDVSILLAAIWMVLWYCELPTAHDFFVKSENSFSDGERMIGPGFWFGIEPIAGIVIAILLGSIISFFVRSDSPGALPARMKAGGMARLAFSLVVIVAAIMVVRNTRDLQASATEYHRFLDPATKQIADIQSELDAVQKDKLDLAARLKAGDPKAKELQESLETKIKGLQDAKDQLTKEKQAAVADLATKVANDEKNGKSAGDAAHQAVDNTTKPPPLPKAGGDMPDPGTTVKGDPSNDPPGGPKDKPRSARDEGESADAELGLVKLVGEVLGLIFGDVDHRDIKVAKDLATNEVSADGSFNPAGFHKSVGEIDNTGLIDPKKFYAAMKASLDELKANNKITAEQYAAATKEVDDRIALANDPVIERIEPYIGMGLAREMKEEFKAELLPTGSPLKAPDALDAFYVKYISQVGSAKQEQGDWVFAYFAEKEVKATPEQLNFLKAHTATLVTPP